MADSIALLRLAINHSGLSVKAFAGAILLRHESTLHRWLSGKSPIPQVVQRWLERNAHEVPNH